MRQWASALRSRSKMLCLIRWKRRRPRCDGGDIRPPVHTTLGGDVDEAHARQRRLGSGHSGENARGQVQKKLTVSTICNAALDKAATELFAKARKDRVPGATYAKCYEYLITKTGLRAVAALEQYSKFRSDVSS